MLSKRKNYLANVKRLLIFEIITFANFLNKHEDFFLSLDRAGERAHPRNLQLSGQRALHIVDHVRENGLAQLHPLVVSFVPDECLEAEAHLVQVHLLRLLLGISRY